jgi:hypothetical protein
MRAEPEAEATDGAAMPALSRRQALELALATAGVAILPQDTADSAGPGEAWSDGTYWSDGTGWVA